MMRHPYAGDQKAQRAAMKRGVYYGTAGFIDPRTYTLDPWVLVRSTGMSWRAAMAVSLRVAVVTGLAIGTVAYLGFDPLNVTPGHGYGPGNMPQYDPGDLTRSIMA